MSSGGIFGKGIGASQQKWGNLPEAHTDFIFAVLGEELGLVGTLLVLALFRRLAYAGIRLAINTEDPFVRYVSAGITIWLMAQMIINIGMVLALLPVIGIPLPLVSYGGSALVPSLVALGLLVGVRALRAGARPARCATPAPATASVGRRRRRAAVTRRMADDGSCWPAVARPGTPRPCSPPPTRCAVATPTSRSPRSARPAGSRRRVVPEAGYPLELIPPVPLPRRPAPTCSAPRAGCAAR